ncbi:hypothetical protein Pcac1_g25953 [Phytophthora cactorum]|nr:hypothetical protein Pcac1_g25953 [Phytophthora cactorum]
MAGVEKAWMAVEKPTGLSNLHTYLKPGKKKKDGVPRPSFFVGEEELMKYLDRVDLGTFERYSSASMSSDVAYRYLAQRCYTEATRKQPRRQQRSHEATKPRSHEAKQAAKAGVRLQRPREEVASARRARMTQGRVLNSAAKVCWLITYGTRLLNH